MIEYKMEKDCVGCPQGCINCGRNERIPHLEDLICDKCGHSEDVLYDANGEQLCAQCILEDYTEINEDNFEDFI